MEGKSIYGPTTVKKKLLGDAHFHLNRCFRYYF